MALPGITRFENRVALVTGASVGIGAAICDSFVRKGLIVVGCARHTEAIDEQAKKLAAEGLPGKLHAVQCDVGKEEQVEEMFGWIQRTLGGVDICVNNAAFTVTESLLDSDPKKIRQMFDVNVIGLIMCSKLTIKSMQSRGVDDGHIININAVLGHEIRGFLNAYAASKYAVTALTEGFKKELLQTKSRIRVTSVSPGMVKTRFLYDMHGPEQAEELYQVHPHIHADDVANTVLFILSLPADVLVHECILENVRAGA